MEPKTFDIFVHAERTTWGGRVDANKLKADIEKCVEYLMLEIINVEVKERA